MIKSNFANTISTKLKHKNRGAVTFISIFKILKENTNF